MEENIPNINTNSLCVYLLIQVYVYFCFSYTNFSHFLMMNFFYYEKNTIIKKKLLRSDQISRSVVSNSLQPHESQHARPPCPSPTPRVHSDSRPSSQ